MRRALALALGLAVLGAIAPAEAHHHRHRHGAPAGGLASQGGFVTIQGTVARLRPDIHGRTGLVHQVFILHETAPEVQDLEVDNDLNYGNRVPVRVGEALTLRGKAYHDPDKVGFHWTHHRDHAGDAGWIRTPDGRTYQ